MNKLYNYILLTATYFLAFSLALINSKKLCNQRLVENSGIVCVCNITYCDDFPPLETQQFAFADVYQSSKNGSRFEKTVLKFEKSYQNSSANYKQYVTINTSETFQTILGFGGSFTDTFGQLLNQLPIAMAYNIIEDYFSTNGSEYTMARTPIGGSDFSPRPYSYDDVDGDLNLTHWKLQTEDIEFKIPYIRLAQNMARELKLFASPWSPPAWMKTNNKFNESGLLRGTVGGEYYQTWANYFVKYLDAYKSNGITLWGITIENEPVEGQIPNNQINVLYLNSSMERDFLKLNLGPTLDKAGYGPDKLKIMIYDENTDKNLQEWADTILSDKEAAKWVAGIAFHWYSNSRTGEFPASLLDSVHQNHSQYFLLNTEACNLTQAGNGRWDFGEDYARDIIRDLNHHTSGWVYWNMALNMNGGPHWNGDQNRGQSSPILIDVNAKEYYKQPMYYVMAHFSKFLRPNSIRVAVELEKTDDKLWVTAFERPDKAIVVIAANLNDVDVEMNILEQKFGILVNTLPAHSIQSYIWWQ